MTKNRKSNMAAAAILNFGKSVILGYSNPDMVNLYQHTNFEANILINDRDMAKNPKCNLATVPILNFHKSVIFV